MRVVYLDMVLLYNALIDYLLLIVSARFLSQPVKRWRCGVSAVFGGLYAAAAYFPWGTLLRHPAAKIFAAVLMALCAFGTGKYFLRRFLMFLLVSSAFAGFELLFSCFAYGEIDGSGRVPFSMPVFLFSLAVSTALIAGIFRGGGRAAARKELVRVTIDTGKEKTVLTALSDSGCTLTDPISGMPVLIVAPEVAASLDVKREAQLPYSSLGGGGMLETIRMKELKIGKKSYQNALIAVAPDTMSFLNGWQAIWGGETERST